VVGGQILGFSIDSRCRPYNTLALPCECVMCCFLSCSHSFPAWTSKTIFARFLPLTPKWHYVFVWSVPSSISCQIYLCRFARILDGFQWNLREVINTKYHEKITFLAKLEKEQGSRIPEKIRLANVFTNFSAPTAISRWFKNFIYKFHTNISRFYRNLFTHRTVV